MRNSGGTMARATPSPKRIGTAVAVALMIAATTAAPAAAHEGEASIPSRELVEVALGVLEVHPAPQAAVEDKIRDAQESNDPRGVDLALVKKAGEALDRGDVASTKRLLEQAIGRCPAPDVLYVADQPPRPPCAVSAHELAQPRRAIGGTGEAVALVIAGLLALAGVLVIRHPFVNPKGQTS